MSSRDDAARTKLERIKRLRRRLDEATAEPRPAMLAAIIKGVLDLLEDEL